MILMRAPSIARAIGGGEGALKISNFLGPEMATSDSSAKCIRAQKSRFSAPPPPSNALSNGFARIKVIKVKKVHTSK